ncbi:MAG: PEP-CTERM sorting domain-containing protein [Verrucomicrobiales bacterium]
MKIASTLLFLGACSLSSAAVVSQFGFPLAPGDTTPTGMVAGDGLFTVRAFNVVAGSDDSDLNDTLETLNMWRGLDARPAGATGYIAGNHNVSSNLNATSSVVDYAGGGGNFGTNLPYSSIAGGAGLGGDDFSVRARTYITLPAGDYSIAAASDDGRYIAISGDNVTPVGAAGAQVTGTPSLGANVFYFNGTTGHNNTIGQFTVGAGGAEVALDTFFFERGGGDSFEVSIANGHQGAFSTPTFELLQDGALGGNAQISSTAGGSDGLFNIQAAAITPGGGAVTTDDNLDNIPETLGVWAAIDAIGPGASGLISANGGTYQVQRNSQTTVGVVDFAGGGGDFGVNQPYSTGGMTGLGGDDFSMMAETNLFLPAGDYTLSVASDDGRRAELLGVTLASTGGQLTGGLGATEWGFDGPSGHDRSYASFSLSEPTALNLSALFFERGGGDSFEIGIANSITTNIANFIPLQNGAFGAVLSSNALTMVPEPSRALLLGLGLAGFVLRRRR